MNRKIKPVVYKILQEDEYAREDDWYLIYKTVMLLVPVNTASTFYDVLRGMKYKGISFEAITRCRRKFMEENPELNPKYIKEVREKEELEYHIGV